MNIENKIYSTREITKAIKTPVDKLIDERLGIEDINYNREHGLIENIYLQKNKEFYTIEMNFGNNNKNYSLHHLILNEYLEDNNYKKINEIINTPIELFYFDENNDFYFAGIRPMPKNLIN